MQNVYTIIISYALSYKLSLTFNYFLILAKTLAVLEMKQKLIFYFYKQILVGVVQDGSKEYFRVRNATDLQVGVLVFELQCHS